MRSLFARIWFSYLLVTALTLAAALTITFALAVKRAGDTDRLSPAALAVSARAALAKDGQDGLNGWIVREAHAHPELRIYFIDGGGRELLSRSVRGKPLSGAAGAMTPSLVAPDGAVYRMLVRRTRGFVFDLWNILLAPQVLLPLALAVSGLGCAWLAHHLTLPVVRLRAGVRAIAAGNLDTRMGADLARRKDELGGLARDFDSMAADLRALIAAKEDLLRDISHELRSPLARLRVAADLARRGATGPAAFDRMDREVVRLDAMIGQILRFSRLGSGPTPARDLVDLDALLEESVEDARIEAVWAGKSVNLTSGPFVHVLGDRALIRSAIENVLRNAVRFAPAGSAVDVRLSVTGGTVRVEVADTGRGVSEIDLPHIFKPFFRADPSNGVGLGLAIAERVFTLHHGAVTAANRRGGGLVVEMTLPALDALSILPPT